MFRDFIYLDTNRVQSIIAQLHEGLLEQVIEGETRESSGSAGITMSLLSLLIPVGFSASVGSKEASSFEQSKVLHDYAFDVALKSLRERSFLPKDELDSVLDTGFVLVKGSARIFDYETLNDMARNWDDLDEFFDPSTSDTARKKKKKDPQNKIIRESKVVLDTFFKDAVRIRITDPQDNGFIGPLIRAHLREDIRNLIFKHGSSPTDEWTMLDEITRSSTGLGEASLEDRLRQSMEANEVSPDGDDQHVSQMLNSVVDVLNSFQDFIGSPSYSDTVVSPIAIYREILPR